MPMMDTGNISGATLKEASTEVARLRVQVGEWQKEIIRREKEAQETQAKWIKQIQGTKINLTVFLGGHIFCTG